MVNCAHPTRSPADLPAVYHEARRMAAHGGASGPAKTLRGLTHPIDMQAGQP